MSFVLVSSIFIGVTDLIVQYNSHRTLVMTRFLLRDGNKITADRSSNGLDVFSYLDEEGNVIHALLTVSAERELLRLVPKGFVPLSVRVQQASVSVCS